MNPGRWLVACLMLAVAAAGCGRKEPPRPLAEAGPPAIEELRAEVNGPALVLDFRLVGSRSGVGYQIDRAEIDPVCRCPSMWRRYFEQPPLPEFAGRHERRLISLKSTEREFLFRIRAVDAEGRLGPWSEPIRARAVDLSAQ